MKPIPLLLILLISMLACEQKEPGTTPGATDLLEVIDPKIKDLPNIDERIFFEGRIEKYPVVMQLDFKNDSIVGKYRYTSQEEYLQLRGYLESDDKVVIHEYTADGIHTGTFRGYAGFRSRFVGDWVKADNTSSLLFELRLTEDILYRPSAYIPSEKLSVQSQHIERLAADSSCSINIYYPVFDGLDPVIAAAINEKLKGPADSVLTQQIAECSGDDYSRENDLPASSIEETFVLSGIKGPVLSVTQNYYAYFSGAAHGNYGSGTTNFDLRNGQVLTPEDLFRSGYDTLLNRLIQERLQNTYPQDHGYFEFEGVGEDQNYVFEPDSLSTYFNPYAIAPYAAGQIAVRFSYEELGSILKIEL